MIKTDIRIVEVGYAYYVGNVQVWDTMQVSIPIDTPDDKIEELARFAALNELETNSDLSIAGIWAHNNDVPIEESEFAT